MLVTGGGSLVTHTALRKARTGSSLSPRISGEAGGWYPLYTPLESPETPSASHSFYLEQQIQHFLPILG